MDAHELEEALEICAGSPAQREELLQLQRSVDGVWLGSLQNIVPSICGLCMGRWELTEMETSILVVLARTLKTVVFPF